MSSHGTAGGHGGVTRRALLRAAAASGLVAGTGGALAACGSSRHESSGQGGAEPEPRPGGTLRIGFLGAGGLEGVNPSNESIAVVNMAMVPAVFDRLVEIGSDLQVYPALATRWSTDQTAATWVFELREGVRWHDGKPFTADDVIYTLRWMSTPEQILSPNVANVDVEGITAQGSHRVVVPLKRPDLFFPDTIADSATIIQDGTTDFRKPVGTGPFRIESSVPGQEHVFRRNPDYWVEGRPFVDELVIRALTDDSARVNALLGGEIDVMAQVPLTQARRLQGTDMKVLRGPSTATQGFYMRVDVAPFDDVRVRQALRLLVDRQQLVDVALSGYGTVAHEFGAGMQFYDDSIALPERDVAGARELLAQAGYGAGLTLQLETAPAAPGMVEAANLFAQQAKEGGVDIQVQQVDPNSYFDPSQRYLKMPFAQTNQYGFARLANFYRFALLPDTAINETHWNNARTTQQLSEAMYATEVAQASRAFAAVQREQAGEGGYIWWANADSVDATSARVGGIKPSRIRHLGLPTSLASVYLSS